jgi:hypothetical protein
MKIIWKSDDEKSYVIKFNKKELKTLVYVLSTDNFFNSKFEVDNIDDSRYLFIQKMDINIGNGIDYLKHCFAKELIDSIIKPEKY